MNSDKLEKQDPKLVDGMPHPRFYPHYTKFTDFASKTVEEFEYLRPMTSSNKSPFLVKLKSSDKRAVVKFVRRYGAGPVPISFSLPKEWRPASVSAARSTVKTT